MLVWVGLGQAFANSINSVKDEPREVPGKVCPECKTNVPQGAKFCPGCGKQLPSEKFCSECGAKITASAKFCPECGNKVA